MLSGRSWHQPALQKVLQRTREGRLEKGPAQPAGTGQRGELDVGSGL